MTCDKSGFCHGAGVAILLLKRRWTARPMQMGQVRRLITLLTINPLAWKIWWTL